MDDILKYAKALAPLVAGVILCIIDKAFEGDAIPDEVWIALMGASGAVALIPNRHT